MAQELSEDTIKRVEAYQKYNENPSFFKPELGSLNFKMHEIMFKDVHIPVKATCKQLNVDKKDLDIRGNEQHRSVFKQHFTKQRSRTISLEDEISFGEKLRDKYVSGRNAFQAVKKLYYDSSEYNTGILAPYFGLSDVHAVVVNSIKKIDDWFFTGFWETLDSAWGVEGSQRFKSTFNYDEEKLYTSYEINTMLVNYLKENQGNISENVANKVKLEIKKLNEQLTNKLETKFEEYSNQLNTKSDEILNKLSEMERNVSPQQSLEAERFKKIDQDLKTLNNIGQTAANLAYVLGNEELAQKIGAGSTAVVNVAWGIANLANTAISSINPAMAIANGVFTIIGLFKKSRSSENQALKAIMQKLNKIINILHDMREEMRGNFLYVEAMLNFVHKDLTQQLLEIGEDITELKKFSRKISKKIDRLPDLIEKMSSKILNQDYKNKRKQVDAMLNNIDMVNVITVPEVLRYFLAGFTHGFTDTNSIILDEFQLSLDSDGLEEQLRYLEKSPYELLKPLINYWKEQAGYDGINLSKVNHLSEMYAGMKLILDWRSLLNYHGNDNLPNEKAYLNDIKEKISTTENALSKLALDKDFHTELFSGTVSAINNFKDEFQKYETQHIKKKLGTHLKQKKEKTLLELDKLNTVPMEHRYYFDFQTKYLAWGGGKKKTDDQFKQTYIKNLKRVVELRSNSVKLQLDNVVAHSDLDSIVSNADNTIEYNVLLQSGHFHPEIQIGPNWHPEKGDLFCGQGRNFPMVYKFTVSSVALIYEAYGMGNITGYYLDPSFCNLRWLDSVGVNDQWMHGITGFNTGAPGWTFLDEGIGGGFYFHKNRKGSMEYGDNALYRADIYFEYTLENGKVNKVKLHTHMPEHLMRMSKWFAEKTLCDHRRGCASALRDGLSEAVKKDPLILDVENVNVNENAIRELQEDLSNRLNLKIRKDYINFLNDVEEKLKPEAVNSDIKLAYQKAVFSVKLMLNYMYLSHQNLYYDSSLKIHRTLLSMWNSKKPEDLLNMFKFSGGYDSKISIDMMKDSIHELEKMIYKNINHFEQNNLNYSNVDLTLTKNCFETYYKRFIDHTERNDQAARIAIQLPDGTFLNPNAQEIRQLPGIQIPGKQFGANDGNNNNHVWPYTATQQQEIGLLAEKPIFAEGMEQETLLIASQFQSNKETKQSKHKVDPFNINLSLASQVMLGAVIGHMAINLVEYSSKKWQDFSNWWQGKSKEQPIESTIVSMEKASIALYKAEKQLAKVEHWRSMLKNLYKNEHTKIDVKQFSSYVKFNMEDYKQELLDLRSSCQRQKLTQKKLDEFVKDIHSFTGYNYATYREIKQDYMTSMIVPEPTSVNIQFNQQSPRAKLLDYAQLVGETNNICFSNDIQQKRLK